MNANLYIMSKDVEGLRQYIAEDPDRFYKEQKNQISPPLLTAATNKDPQSIRIMLECGADPNEQSVADGMTPLMAAVWEGSAEAVKLLLEYGAAPNTADKDKWTALFHAAHKGNMPFVDKLLIFGADPGKRDIYNKTPSVKAKEAGHIKLAEKLTPAGMDQEISKAALYVRSSSYDDLENWILEGYEINAGLANGSGLLHLAVEQEDVRMLELLLSYGANVNRRNGSRDTALHMACKKDNIELVQLLLEHPACWTKSRNGQWRIPIEETECEPIKQLFEQHNPKDSLHQADFEWMEWLEKLYSKMHLRVDYLLELALDAGMTTEMNKQAAWEKLNAAETPQAAGLALALDYFKIASFPNKSSIMYGEVNRTSLGKYVAACTYFDAGKPQEGISMLQELAEDGFSPAGVTLAGIYQLTNGPEDEIYTLYLRTAEQGNRKAMMELSKCYFYGRGTSSDVTLAMRWFRKANQEGIADIEFSNMIDQRVRKTRQPGGQADKIIRYAEKKSKPAGNKAIFTVSALEDVHPKHTLLKVKNLPYGHALKSRQVKGMLTELTKLKKKLSSAEYPEYSVGQKKLLQQGLDEIIPLFHVTSSLKKIDGNRIITLVDQTLHQVFADNIAD
jgi:FOG: Ankyrin repeat